MYLNESIEVYVLLESREVINGVHYYEKLVKMVQNSLRIYIYKKKVLLGHYSHYQDK